jgi:caspase domain-containing protein
VLVGVSRFPKDPINLPELPAVAANVEDLKRVLTDLQLVGIPDENIIMLLDEQNPHTVTSRVADEARKAVDTFIFYYAGHGIVGRTSRELYLATQETTHQNAEFGTAISFETIRRAMAQSTAPKRILILDCCYSGRALAGAMGSESDVQRAQLDLQGAYSIASAPANKAAISPPGERHTAFTGELLKVLDGGLDNGKEELTISDVYNHIRNEFRRRTNLPDPQQSMYQDAGSFVIAHNRKCSPDRYEKQPDVKLPPELQQVIESPLAGVRLGAVDELSKLLRSSNPGLVLVSYQALEQLRNDDSRRVSEAASQILETHAKAQRLGKEAGAASKPEVINPPETDKP